MIEIRARESDTVLLSLPADSLAGASFAGRGRPAADLAGAELSRAFFAAPRLEGADLTGATLGRTVLAACADLALARGLEAVVHHGHSCLDLATLRAGLASLPEAFLHG